MAKPSVSERRKSPRAPWRFWSWEDPALAEATPEQRELFFFEQYQHTVWPVRAAMMVGAVVFLLRGWLDEINGMVVPNFALEMGWRSVIFALMCGMIVLYGRSKQPRTGYWIMSWTVALMVFGIMLGAYVLPERVPYTLVPVTITFLFVMSMWPRQDFAVMTVLLCSMPVAWLVGANKMSVHDAHTWLLYLLVGGFIGFLLRRGRIKASFEAFVLRQHLINQALRDPLTGALNRSGWATKIVASFASGTPEHPSCLLFFDLDHFKSINDTHGHPAGDALICATVDTIQSHLRQTDLLARFGGEEFVVLLPSTALRDGRMVAERIRKAIEQASLEVKTTVSVGAAELQRGETLEQVMARADEALLVAKRSGRNQVCVADA